MIGPEDRKQIEGLQATVHCTKGFRCVYSSLSDLCEGKYHADIDVLECLGKCDPECKFARPFGCTLICTCPLRKLIAKNFDRWSAEETVLLRHEGGAPAHRS